MRTATALSTFAALACLATAPSAQDYGPDAFGYIGFNILPAFNDISGTGTNITQNFGANLDDAGQVVGLGFDFSFYGMSVSTIGISTNGYLADDNDLTDFTNDCPIATTTTPNRGIYPFFDDLRLTEHGDVFVETQGSTGGQVFIAQFDDVGTFDDSSANLTFQVKIFEADASIEYHYLELTDGTIGGFDASGGGATVGVEDNGNGGLATGLSISCDMTGSVTTDGAFRIENCESLRAGSCGNPIVYTSTEGCPSVDSTWQGSVDHSVFLPNAVMDFAFCSSGGPIDMPTPNGCLLCSPVGMGAIVAVPAGDPILFDIPDDSALAGLAVCTQAASIAPPDPMLIGPPITLRFTNAIDTTMTNAF